MAFICAFVFGLLVQQGTQAQSGVMEQIRHVETSLLPHAVPQGELGSPATIEQRMAYHDIPAVSIAVIEDGKVQWAKAYGVTQRNSGRPVTPQTLFQAASVSKTVCALGALRLSVDRHISLDEDVNLWLHSWKVPESPLTVEQKVSLRRLLNHTAGLTVDGFSGYSPGSALPTTQQILDGQQPANNPPVRVSTVPGSRFSYSGGGYVVIQQLIADTSGLPFDQYMHEAVFTKLAMTSSTYGQPPGASEAACGYSRDGAKVPGNWKVHPEMAPAGLWTTPTDLAQVIIELQDAMAGRPSRVLPPQLARQMLSAPTGSNGLGVFLTGPNGAARRFMHSGRNAGFDAMLVGYKNGRKGAVIMINRNNNGGFIDEVLESVAREYHWPGYRSSPVQREYVDISIDRLNAYARRYQAPDHRELRIEIVEGHLFAKPGEDPWMPLFPASTTEFFSSQNDTTWIFSRGGKDLLEKSGAHEVHWTAAESK